MNILKINGKNFKEMLVSGANNLSQHESEVNELNVFPVPDGDTGTNMLNTLEGGLMQSKDTDNLGEFMQSLSKGMLLNARGNSGVILSQLFKGQALYLKTFNEASALDLCDAIEMGYKTAYKAVINPAEGTILTVAREGVRMIKNDIDANTSINSLIMKLLFQMKIALDNTPNLLHVLKEAGVVDSGGAGLIYIYEGMKKYLDDEVIKRYNGEVSKKSLVKANNFKENKIDTTNLFDENTILTYGYCTEFILQLQPKLKNKEFNLDEFIKFLNTLGDSIVAIQDDLIVKVHVHTKTPGVVFNKAQEYGEFITIKSENMNIQHNEVMTIKPNKKFAIISTIESEEEDEILKNIHADKTLMMNETSTNDFINAINSINASKYFVLSNDKNVVLAIEQAKTLIDKNIEIIKTTNMVEGYFALESLMLEDYDTLDATRVSKLLNEGMDATNAILFTKASKDSNINSVNVLNGDFIAINKGKIIAASKDLIDLVLKSISLVTDDLSQVSMFTGKSLDIDPYDILDKISDEFGADGVVIDTKDQKYVLMIGVC